MMKNKADIKESMKAYYESNRDEILAKRKAYYKAHKEERKAYQKARYEAHKVELRSKKKIYNEAHKEERKAYRQAHSVERKAYDMSDTNFQGRPKAYIRQQSNYYLFNTLKHSKLKGYEIHHCFGYDDYKCFIYIPKELHLQIHQYLRDNGISADTDHYNKIAHLVVAWDGYVYIKS